jgi:hypothetical protein
VQRSTIHSFVSDEIRGHAFHEIRCLAFARCGLHPLQLRAQRRFRGIACASRQR